MTNRQMYLNKLENIVKVSSSVMISGSLLCNFLYNANTKDHCQIVECIDNDGKGIPMPLHKHINSREIFYQLKGSSVFSDGFELSEGNIRIIEKDVPHSVSISEGGAVIVIVHPKDESYEALLNKGE